MKNSLATRSITLLVQFSALIAFIMSLKVGNWFNSVSALWAFIITFLPYAFEKWQHIKLPTIFIVTVVLFDCAALILGEFGEFYLRFPWWDNMLHSFSGFALSLAVFSTMLYIYRTSKQLKQLSPGMLILFSFCFAVACGAIWEIIEFSMDRIFGSNMQRWQDGGIAGLLDTMTDLIMDTSGAIVANVIGYTYLKRTNLIAKMRKIKLEKFRNIKKPSKSK